MRYKVQYSEGVLIEHLRHNIVPRLEEKTIEAILETIQKFNNGELSPDDPIKEGSKVTVAEMLEDLKLEYVDLDEEEEEEEEESNPFLESLYHEIDAECIENTDTVRMSTIKRLFAQYGAREDRME